MELRLRTILCGWFGLKLLLTFCYVSTDFEVHRNWLAITYNLPINKWYVENTSIWTLDYPPFFAWFEYGLSHIGALFLLNGTTASESHLLGIRPESTNLTSDKATLIFQRLTVAVTDLVHIFGAITCVRFMFSDQHRLTIAVPPNRRPLGEYVLNLLLCCNIGLLLVDNIHFQYNGFLFGFLLFSIADVGKERYLSAALLFAMLLNLKHIFLYLAPAFAVYFLRNYCFNFVTSVEQKGKRHSASGEQSSAKWSMLDLILAFSFSNFLKLLIIGIAIFALSFAPFIYLGQLNQLLSRLFPFKRGLTHACWAPNFWALYNAIDYVSAIICKRLRIISYDSVPGYATGLVQEFDHLVLPNIKPIATFLITILTMLPACLLVAIKKTTWDGFINVLTLCAFSSFLFGWHVHEKAILLVLIPATLLTIFDHRYVKIFLILSASGYFSLFPLLYQRFESVIKYSVYFVYMAGAFYGLQTVYRLPSTKSVIGLPTLPFLNIFETLYVIGFVPLKIGSTLIEYMPIFSKFTFAPLLLTSVYCSIGVIYCWILLYWVFIDRELNVKTHISMKKWRKERLLLRKQLIVINTELWQGSMNFGDGLSYIGGLDVSTPVGDHVNAVGCLAVLRFPDLQVLYSICEHVMIDVSYVPGFLAFREGPIMISLVERLKRQRPDLMPQVLFVDGNGLLHPDRFGLACHVGVLLDIPTIGVAKDLHLIDGLLRPSQAFLEQELTTAGSSIMLISNNTTLGAAVRTSQASKNAIFVSIGHRFDLDTAIKFVVMCSKHRVPEPIRAADMISREYVRQNLL